MPTFVMWILLTPGVALLTEDPQPPEVLRQVLHNRAAVDLAAIEWSVDFWDDRGESVTKTWGMTSKFVDGDELAIIHGDENGCLRPEALGELGACSEERILIKDGMEWLFLEHTGSCSVQGGRPGDSGPARRMTTVDVRTLGLYSHNAPWPIEGFWTRQGSVSRFDVVQKGDQCEVKAFLDSATGSDSVYVQWTIDVLRGPNPVRTAVIHNGTAFREATCELEKFGDRWLPAVTTLKMQGRRLHTVRLESVVLDDPDLIPPLSLKDLSLPAGIQVSDGEDPYGKFWDGEKLLTPAEFGAAIRAGTIDQSEATEIYRYNKTPQGYGRFPFPGKSRQAAFLVLDEPVRKPGLWEEYVRLYVRLYQMDAAQRRRAWVHLRACQKPAMDVLAKQAQGERDVKGSLEGLTGEALEQRTVSVQDRLARMKEATDQALDRQFKNLRDGLWEMLTPRQREEGAQRIAALKDGSSSGT
ncbi:MAG: hypothetical protein KJ057_15650 [Phycisphaerae bacterium]|nr:MAG: hypothetical protein EDS66_10025 [Planctomycetota bacterium]KAB2939250.1 MAG: hypothetical protein F9K17_15305 [Phycisphaerae bacterium]MBE7456205.1 hypothetical protein [Planctomycetia bacterium]MCK6464754.1 hypothetical protein [Phycisphaerae bacterium]MCL4719904.1 hypothetical protein [Phycisphaerae bacterium]